MDPLSPLTPTDYSQCSALEQSWERLEEEVSRMHQDCLDAHAKSKEQKNPDSGQGQGSKCTYPACQSLHNRLFEIGARKAPAVDSCRAQVEKHQDEVRRQQEEDERRKREQEERERAAKEDEQRRREAAAEQKREGETRESKERSDREEAERKREETNRRLIEEAEEQSRRAQEALAQRTEERRQQMEELKKREQGVNDRYEQKVEEHTRDAQNSLQEQIARNASAENGIFPTPEQANTKGDEFDLGSTSGGSRDEAHTPAGALPELAPEYEGAAAPERGTTFSEAYDKVKDFLSPFAEKGMELIKERLRGRLDENVKEVESTMLAGAFGEDGSKTARDMAKKFFDDSYKDPLREMVGTAYDKAAAGPVKEVTEEVAKVVGEHLRYGTGPLGGDGVIGALRDVSINVAVEKLNDHLKETFVEQVTAKTTEVYRGLSERIFGPSDNITRPVQDTALLRLPSLIVKAGSPTAAAKALYDYGVNMVNAMGEMFDRLSKSDLYGTAPPDDDPERR